MSIQTYLTLEQRTALVHAISNGYINIEKCNITNIIRYPIFIFRLLNINYPHIHLSLLHI